jgi:hypothetical protein
LAGRLGLGWVEFGLVAWSQGVLQLLDDGAAAGVVGRGRFQQRGVLAGLGVEGDDGGGLVGHGVLLEC